MFYLLDKEKGISSFKAIKKFAIKNNIKKVGHTGTLDPLATGLLLIATDDDTKLIEYVDKGFKKYKAECEFGKISNTYDIEGDVKKTNKLIPNMETIFNTIKKFEGNLKQIPPSYSAKKINGQKAYKLARMGKEVKLKEIAVTTKDIKIISNKNNKLIFEITVSRGTYIRIIIHDLGKELGCGAIMTNLRRIEIGFLTEKNLNKEIDIKKLLIYKTIQIEDISNIKDGKSIKYDFDNGKFALEYKNKIIGICEINNSMLKPIKLFGNKL